MVNYNPFDLVDLLQSFALHSLDGVGNDVLFHYTNPALFESIVRDDYIELWHMKHDEDPLEHTISEIMNFYRLALDNIKKQLNLKSSNVLSDLETIEINNQYLFIGSITKQMNGVAYICCFTPNTHSSSLNEMINEKYHVDPAILAFNATDLFEERNKSFDKYRHFFLRMIYNDDEKIKVIESFLASLLRLDLTLMALRHCVVSFLNLCRFSFKPIDYIGQQEIRSLIILNESQSAAEEVRCKILGQKSHFSLILEKYDYIPSLTVLPKVE